jgi:gluconolactonase
MAIDKKGNLWATGPGGVLGINPSRKHLRTLLTGVPTANSKFGDDGSTLYITAKNPLGRIRTKATGLGF